MVIMPLMVEFIRMGLLAEMTAVTAEPLLERLEPPQRAVLLMALLGIMLVGMLLVAFVLLGGNWARRMARHRPHRRADATPPLAGDGGRLARDALAGVDPHARSDETVHGERASNETKPGHDR